MLSFLWRIKCTDHLGVLREEFSDVSACVTFMYSSSACMNHKHNTVAVYHANSRYKTSSSFTPLPFPFLGSYSLN